MSGFLFRLGFRPHAHLTVLTTQRGLPFLKNNNKLGTSVLDSLQTRAFSAYPRILSRPIHNQWQTRSFTPSKKDLYASPLRRWLSGTRWSNSPRYHSPPPPPKREFLAFLDRIPPNAVFVGIISINVAVFAIWLAAKEKYRQERDPTLLLWMKDHFFTSWKNFSEGRVYTLMTSVFSHMDWSHILFNGFTFFFMANPVLEMLGSRNFILLYLGGGLVSSVSSLAYAKMVGKVDYNSHGASGAIYTIVTLLACVAPKLTFQLYGIIPVPAWLAVSGFFTYDMYRTISEKSGTTDTVGHIAGILAGIGYYLGKRFRLF
ncbi:RHOMBOID-like protein 12, mitochondrial [Psilocybe cubensis]|uniref:Peptidase S54 rhomboid domain-containing protein n=2 Tax=Psilocybe cubensis TaxID=181762 RepID=A0A8H7XYU7_PSICU|nr:RHOMBOID-like protein 12, mitochondrial [Psilocybe cubensis]KAH9483030.1 RHOMBOID-like protein 12, mitochondrial [Psilocybe cubensis]